MGSHFEILEAIFRSADEELQRAMLWTMDAVLDVGSVDLTGIEADPSDDVLVALRKREARRAAHGASFQRELRWELFVAAFARYVDMGMSASFLVTSLLEVIEQDLAFLVEGTLDSFLQRNSEMLNFLDTKIREAHPEDRDRLLNMKEVLLKARQDAPENDRVNRDRYARWRALAGSRLQMPRIHGGWKDCFEKDSLEGSFREDFM